MESVIAAAIAGLIERVDVLERQHAELLASLRPLATPIGARIKRISLDDQLRMVEMKRDGLGNAGIGRQIGCSTQTVRNQLKKAGVLL